MPVPTSAFDHQGTSLSLANCEKTNNVRTFTRRSESSAVDGQGHEFLAKIADLAHVRA